MEFTKEQLKELEKLIDKKAEEKAEQKLKKAETEESEEAKKYEEYMNERVEVTLYYDGKYYKDDVSLTLNGEKCVIKRGHPVMVKRKFALLIDDALRQEVSANHTAQKFEDDYLSNSKKFDY